MRNLAIQAKSPGEQNVNFMWRCFFKFIDHMFRQTTGLKALSSVAIFRRLRTILSKVNPIDYEKIADKNRSTKIGLR